MFPVDFSGCFDELASWTQTETCLLFSGVDIVHTWNLFCQLSFVLKHPMQMAPKVAVDFMAMEAYWQQCRAHIQVSFDVQPTLYLQRPCK